MNRRTGPGWYVLGYRSATPLHLFHPIHLVHLFKAVTKRSWDLALDRKEELGCWRRSCRYRENYSLGDVGTFTCHCLISASTSLPRLNYRPDLSSGEGRLRPWLRQIPPMSLRHVCCLYLPGCISTLMCAVFTLGSDDMFPHVNVKKIGLVTSRRKMFKYIFTWLDWGVGWVIVSLLQGCYVTI